MQKHILIVVVIILITTLSGCLSTLHPLFTEKDLVFDPRLLGQWQTDEKNEAVFEQGTAASFSELPAALRNLASRAYMVTIKKNKKLVRYHAFLCRIGKEYFLDYYPAEAPHQKTYDEFYKMHFTKMHSFYRLRFRNNNEFETGQFDESYLTDLINRKQIRIQHEVRSDGTYVITAPTEELQQYVLKYSDVDAAYNSSTHTNYKKIQ